MSNWRWDNFSPKEVLSPMGLQIYASQEILMVRPEAMDMLQAFREDLGIPLYVNHAGLTLRGYRHYDEHRVLHNGAKFSQHVQGCAFDVSSIDVEPLALYQQALDFGWTGVGLYETFVHMDIRFGPPVCWDNRLRRSGRP